MKNKMVGISAVLLIALMLAGVSYALWSKYIYIDGTVHTGTLDAIFEGPFTWTATYNDSQSVPQEKLTGITVTVNTAENDPETLLVTIDGLYPCITIHINYNITNTGTTPWVVNDVSVSPQGFPGTVTVTPSNLVGTQVDAGKSIAADLEVHLTNDAAQNTEYTFSVTIHVVQWNEYPVS
ncbi:MAG: hypothetical protein QXR76_06410 [Candidatus Bathyarchaeia archaeon]